MGAKKFFAVYAHARGITLRVAFLRCSFITHWRTASRGFGCISIRHNLSRPVASFPRPFPCRLWSKAGGNECTLHFVPPFLLTFTSLSCHGLFTESLLTGNQKGNAMTEDRSTVISINLDNLILDELKQLVPMFHHRSDESFVVIKYLRDTFFTTTKITISWDTERDREVADYEFKHQ
jgi:hypothetical protein